GHLIKNIRQIRPDIVHGQYVTPGVVSIVATRRAGVKNILATVHYSGRQHGWKAKLLLRSGASLCKAFFCVSKAVEKSWFGDSAMFDHQLATTGRKHFTIYNSIDKAVIESGIQNSDLLNLDKNHPIIGVVGRLSREKGHRFLVRAMGDIVKQIPDIKLVVVGEGSEGEALLREAESLNINNSIIWLGKKDYPETLAIISVFDLLVVPSLSEGFGLVAVEAMASSTPVVASGVDGLMEVIQDGETGWFVTPGDVSELAEKVVWAVKNKQKRKQIAESGLKQAKERFSLERYEKVILRAYNTFGPI
ncbi:MAG: glycosyltransferase family 4 protein, partial [Magnetococcales bacterium]|nr:glycosyltransferase family 4 protein [Magnetococcales bacterium]